MNDDKKLLAKRANASVTQPKKSGQRGSFLAKVRAATATAPGDLKLSTRGQSALVATALKHAAGRPRLVFAIDATASRQPAWEAARATTDALFDALPGQLDVALAVHGGSRVKLFTEFVPAADTLRTAAAAVRCEIGTTRLVELMERTCDVGDVKVLVYIGDVFEESGDDAERVATALRLRGTRVLVLHDRSQGPALDQSAEVFQRIATITQGAVLPFEPEARDDLRAVLEAVATLAVGGVKLLRARTAALPAAAGLLRQLREDV